MDSILANVAEIRRQLQELAKQKQKSLGDIPHRVIHLTDNPISAGIKSREAKLQAMKKENPMIRARLSLLESNSSPEMTMRIEDVANSNIHIETLTRKINHAVAHEKNMLNTFKQTTRDFKEALYLMTGYKVDPMNDDVYRLSHMYAEQEEDQLFIQINPDGTLNLLKNKYTDRYSNFISTYLEGADSFPAFLASITLDLFKSSTQAFDVSCTMSSTNTTIIENTRYDRTFR